MTILDDDKKMGNALFCFEGKLGHVCLTADEAKPFTQLEHPMHDARLQA